MGTAGTALQEERWLSPGHVQGTQDSMVLPGARGPWGTVLSRKPTGGNWEFQVSWLLIGWVVTASHWLDCCQGRWKLFLLLLSVKAARTV